MIYATLDVVLRAHPRTVESVTDLPAGAARSEKRAAVFGLFCAALSYCREHKLDGVISKSVVCDELCGPGMEDVLNRLVRVGLFVEAGDAFAIHRYSEKNDTRAQIEARIASAQSRKERHLKKRVSGNGKGTRSERVPPGVGVGVNADGDVDDQDPEGEREREPPTTNAARLADREARYSSAYVRGITAGKGSPWAWANGFADQAMLNQTINTFAKGGDGTPLRGEAVIAWLEERAHMFARAVVASGEDPSFWSGYGAKGFLRFANMGWKIASGSHSRSTRQPVANGGSTWLSGPSIDDVAARSGT